MNMVRAEGLTYSYTKILETDHGTEEQKVTALKQVDIQINKGDFCCCIGTQWFWKIDICKTYQCFVATNRRYHLGGKYGYQR